MLALLLMCILLILFMIISIMNYFNIQKYHDNNTEMYNTLSKKLNNLNEYIVNKFRKNEKINMYLLNSIVDKIDNITEENKNENTELENQIIKLKQNLKFLIDNSDLYNEFMGSI